jgi:RNA polymerase sigma-70 factor (ECF subfamily)
MSFKALVDNHSKAVMNTAIRILRDPHKAQDVHQEVFLKILRRWHKFNGDVNWPAYLYRTTVRTAVDFAKDSKAVLPPEHRQPNPAKEERPDWRLRAAELQQKLVACLAKLPKRQADAFVLLRIEGLEYDKVAELLGCSQETVRVHLHRALKRLARELSDYLRK